MAGVCGLALAGALLTACAEPGGPGLEPSATLRSAPAPELGESAALREAAAAAPGATARLRAAGDSLAARGNALRARADALTAPVVAGPRRTRLLDAAERLAQP